jgi:hypothetical protein
MLGGRVCRFHGGSSPQARAAAERRLAEQAAESMLAPLMASIEVKPITDPLQVLLDVTSEAVALKDFFSERVGELKSLRYSGSAAMPEVVRGEVLLYERSLDRVGRSVVGRPCQAKRR